MSDDLGAFLAERAVATELSDIDPAAVEVARRAVIDTLGVSLAGLRGASDYIDPVRSFTSKHAAPGDVPALGLGRRIAPLDAVFWQGALAHSVYFDDLCGHSHPSAPVVSAVLPLAYLTGPVSGERLLTAVALGEDLTVRVAESLDRPLASYGWLSSLPGVLAATLASAVVLGLDVAQTRNALGIALHKVSGTMQAIARPGSSYPAIRGSKDAKEGVISALLASEGLPGDPESFEGEFGLFSQFFRGEYDRDRARRPEFLGSRIAVKPWPTAAYPQLFLTALQELVDEGRIRVGEIERITVKGHVDLLPQQCAPLADRAEPRRSIDAKTSIPFLIGKLLVRGTVGLGDFTPQGLRDAEAVELAYRVGWELDPSLLEDANDLGSVAVEVVHRDGTRASTTTKTALGYPEAPLSWDALVAKFRGCVDFSGVPLPPGSSDRLVTLVEELEDVDDARVVLETAFEGER
ncbi:MmgE/PrpD family protein [Cnuibacter physcomitrellae]|uniref:MmgE/PrpD family protein n=1 Tax=Cnuibacter physcomitrellae TaxID=1619308 RepID=UPI002175AA01|nr:MmgE/PrpD family protein [Cnuibacter physcomitrellae]MCS5498255.1 MmgE/PrpD family protein [Cnuibacter physcomitrellae]